MNEDRPILRQNQTSHIAARDSHTLGFISTSSAVEYNYQVFSVQRSYLFAFSPSALIFSAKFINLTLRIIPCLVVLARLGHAGSGHDLHGAAD